MLVVDGCDEIGSRTSDLVSTTRGVHALKGLALLESGSGGGLEVSCQYIGLWFCVHLHRLTFSLRSMEESSPTPWTWFSPSSTGLSDWVPLRGMVVDLGGCLVVRWVDCCKKVVS